jgi:hypothetical protein
MTARFGKSLSQGQPQTRHQPAEIIAFFQTDTAAINLRDISHDREAKAGARLICIESLAAIEQLGPVLLRNSLAIIFNMAFNKSADQCHCYKNAAAAIFGRILYQVAQHFIQILPLDTN